MQFLISPLSSESKLSEIMSVVCMGMIICKQGYTCEQGTGSISSEDDDSSLTRTGVISATTRDLEV